MVMEYPAMATIAEGSPSHNDGVDSISSLPDEIIHKILSLVSTKRAIRTSVLSKRWRHVWCETPCFYFHGLNYSAESIIKTLASYAPSKITSFRLYTTVKNKETAPVVNSMIEFAMSRNVGWLSLEASKGYCMKIPICTVSWPSLKSLSLTYCKVSDESLSNMLSGCPMLESLKLMCVESLFYLDLRNSLSLKRLAIQLRSFNEESLAIVAPHIYSLRLKSYRIHSSCELSDVSSLTKANINFRKSVPSYYCHGYDHKGEVQRMLQKLQNVENLTLGVSFLQTLSIAKFRGVPFPTFKVKTLTLETRILPSVVPGIAKLLQNSPELKKVTLHTIKYRNTQSDKTINTYLDKQDLNLDPAFWESEVAEPNLVALFAELLLANTSTLETLVLRLGRYFDRSRLQELSKITQTLSRNNKVSIVIK